jgi:hypothetical protein
MGETARRPIGERGSGIELFFLILKEVNGVLIEILSPVVVIPHDSLGSVSLIAMDALAIPTFVKLLITFVGSVAKIAFRLLYIPHNLLN